jgi:virginiamycin B lyase
MKNPLSEVAMKRLFCLLTLWAGTCLGSSLAQIEEYTLPEGTYAHDVAPADDGTVWWTAQGTGQLGRLDPRTGESELIDLGSGSSPHGVIVGPDGHAWVTDSGLNTIVRVNGETNEVTAFPLETDYANLNTATFDNNGILWFTGQSGVYGSVNPETSEVVVYEAPRGTGPYGITTTPTGEVYYASLAGSHIARIDKNTGQATVIEPPTPNQGARRVWSDSQGRIWVSEWLAGQLGMYDSSSDSWQEWVVPGEATAKPYAVYVDDKDIVWLSDFGNNALVSFDPTTETFTAYPLPTPNGNVRQLLGRAGEVWGGESSTNKIIVLRTQP